MYKPTLGDLRLIDESTRAWHMVIDPILEKMEELPEEILQTIKSLSGQYSAELQDFYCKAMEEDGGRLADPIFREFDEKWDKEHPEFYDVDKLFEKASDQDKERAKDVMAAAREAFGEA
ncbi:MAG: hypothetical protein K6F35_06410 [Lachnospiraceae bacterium]|nr:hypothetical protein [Lachnospiraceae bacterium]